MMKFKAWMVGWWLVASLFAPLYAQDAMVPEDYPTIQEAIDALQANPGLGSTIEIAPGVYEENITITSPLILRGEEAARTVINALNPQDPTVSIANTFDVTLRNLTFAEGELAIDVVNAIDITINNNIFVLDDQALATRFDFTTLAEVEFNVFYGNDTAVQRDNQDIVIRNNIFAENNLAISGAGAQVSYNCFYNNTADGVIGTPAIVDEDPLFVDVDKLDFHLRSGSPCIDEGDGTDVLDESAADIGAYGGADADVIPFPVQEVKASDVSQSVGAHAIAVTWLRNRSYLITHNSEPGGYLLYYDTDKSGAPYIGEGANGGSQKSPIDVGDVDSYTLTDLTVDGAIPLAPAISDLQPQNKQIAVSWQAVAGASGYTLYYGINNVEEHKVEVGNRLTYTVSNLQNGTAYQFAVRANAQAQYYIAVKAYDSTDAHNESDYSEEVIVQIGQLRVSELSAVVSAIPEQVVPVPDLPNEGCFIASAAFGFYSAEQVEWLRAFRDVHLKRFVLGRWFVKVYYAYSPIVAAQIRQDVYLQNVTRLVLSPLIMLSALLIHWQLSAFLFAGLVSAIAFVCMRRQLLARGMPR